VVEVAVITPSPGSVAQPVVLLPGDRATMILTKGVAAAEVEPLLGLEIATVAKTIMKATTTVARDTAAADPAAARRGNSRHLEPNPHTLGILIIAPTVLLPVWVRPQVFLKVLRVWGLPPVWMPTA
jgi:hypothetical protein